MTTLETYCGTINGIETESCKAFLGIPYAKAERFQYAVPVKKWTSPLDATHFGPSCPQIRTYYQHLEVPKRYFFHKEFRDGLNFEYDEDCLNLNIYTPEAPGKYPVIVYFHGGGFDSGSNNESPFDGEGFAKRGVITVFANYRVGIFGYFTHEEIQKQCNRDGNFGLDDQLKAVQWVKANIAAFGGDPDNITVMGQSAGAISIQYLCLNNDHAGLFKKAVMMSGGGKFPNFALPRPAAATREYWLAFMKHAGAASFEEIKKMPCKQIFDALETFKPTRKDNTYNTMPVLDGFMLKEPVQKLIHNPLKIDYMLGYTNCDMYAPLMAIINHKFARQNGAYLYYFDINAKGDDSRAFHSSDLRYMFNTLNKSWRPYTEEDYAAANLIEDYAANFVRTGNPNDCSLGDYSSPLVTAADSQTSAIDASSTEAATPTSVSPAAAGTVKATAPLPLWKKAGHKALHIRAASDGKIKMTGMHFFKLLHNMLTGGKQI